MIDTADPTGEVKSQMRPHQGPAQPRPGTDRRINIGHTCHPFCHQVQRLPPQRRLQPIGDMPRHLAADMDRLLADRAVEGERPLDRHRTRLLAANDLDQRHQMRGIEGVADDAAFGVPAISLSRLINSPDELEAMTISGSRTASSRASKARFSSSRSGALSWTNSAPARAASGSVWKLSAAQGTSAGSGDSRARLGHAASTNSRRKVSAPGAGSLAATLSPRAKNTTVQLAPIVPVPIAATRLIWSPAMPVSSRPLALAEAKANMSDRDDRASLCSPGGEVRPL